MRGLKIMREWVFSVLISCSVNDNHSQLMANTTYETMTINAENRVIEITRSTINSEKLFGQAKELTIEHKQDVYRLRLTGNDKLILTK